MQSSTLPHVLIIEPACDDAHANALCSMLGGANLDVRILPKPPTFDDDATETLTEIVRECQPSLIILAFDQHVTESHEQLKSCLSALPSDVPIIVAVQNPDATQISSMLELGATDFITPPFTAANVLPRVWQLLRLSKSCFESRSSLEEKLALKRSGLLGESPPFLEEIRKVRLLARCDVTVMVWGETGTGKELVARAIHYLSHRSHRPFVPIDCGAIPSGLAESELFGHERGAFTGAHAKHHGLISAADQGTLFLDEVDALSLSVQSKLLRLLQEFEYRPVGSRQTRKADLRVIAATNRDLQRLVRAGEFREDLYYRLNVAQLRLPALRQRREDVALLARHFVAKHAARFHLPTPQFSPGALQKLLLYHWPGNIRELENVVEAAVAMSDGPLIRSSDLLLAEQSESPRSFREAKARLITEFEREYVVRVLNACGGNISEAARTAGKNRRAFWELIRKHEVDVSELRDSDKQEATRKTSMRPSLGTQ